MARLSAQIIVEAPADAVWEVVGRRFDRIGEWATAIPGSLALPPSPSSPPAPVAGRVCATGVPFVPSVTEMLVAYDEAGRTLTYEAAGLPAFVTAARSTWTVTPLAPRRSRVTIEARIETRGPLGLLGRVAMLAQAELGGRRLARDLRHYVEHGAPSPRKRRQGSAGRREPC
jgi:hypothetical protein